MEWDLAVPTDEGCEQDFCGRTCVVRHHFYDTHLFMDTSKLLCLAHAEASGFDLKYELEVAESNLKTLKKMKQQAVSLRKAVMPKYLPKVGGYYWRRGEKGIEDFIKVFDIEEPDTNMGTPLGLVHFVCSYTHTSTKALESLDDVGMPRWQTGYKTADHSLDCAEFWEAGWRQIDEDDVPRVWVFFLNK